MSAELSSERRVSRSKHEGLVNQMTNIIANYESAEAEAAKWKDKYTHIEAERKSEVEV